MKELEPTWGRTLQVWWSLTWRAVVWVLPVTFFTGAILGAVMAFNHVSVKAHLWEFRIVGGAMGVAIGIWVLKGILSKEFSGFRIALIEVTHGADAHTCVQANVPAPGEPAG